MPYNRDTIMRLYQIGGADLALRYAEIAESNDIARRAERAAEAAKTAVESSATTAAKATETSEGAAPAESDAPADRDRGAGLGLTRFPWDSSLPFGRDLGSKEKAFTGFDIADLVPKAKRPQKLGFDGWLKKLHEDYALPSTAPTSSPEPLLDDAAKMRRLMAIDRRQLFALPNTMMGRAKPELVRELEAIAADYEALLQAGAPTTPFYSEKRLRSKIGDTLGMAARACDSLRDHDKARRLQQAAAKAYRLAGEEEKAKDCEAAIARSKAEAGRGVDAEVRMLRAELAQLPAGGPARAEKLIDFGLLYHRNGDDLEAIPFLEEAEAILAAEGGEPGGADLADALTKSLLGIMDGKSSGTSAPIERKMRVRGLYRVLYSAYARVYAHDDAKAAHYRAKEAQIDGRKENDEFSSAMLSALQGPLGKR